MMDCMLLGYILGAHLQIQTGFFYLETGATPLKQVKACFFFRRFSQQVRLISFILPEMVSTDCKNNEILNTAIAMLYSNCCIVLYFTVV